MDQGESLAWLGPLEDLVNLECQEKQEDRDHQELLVWPGRRDPMDQEVHPATGDHQDRLECQALRVRRDPLGLTAQLGQQDPEVHPQVPPVEANQQQQQLLQPQPQLLPLEICMAQ